MPRDDSGVVHSDRRCPAFMRPPWWRSGGPVVTAGVYCAFCYSRKADR